MGLKLTAKGTRTEFPTDTSLYTPLDFVITSVGITTMDLAWTQPIQGGATGYRFYDAANNLLGAAAWGATVATIEGLTAGTSYTIDAVTTDGILESTPSTAATDTTATFAGWQLATNYYEPEKLPMTLASPQTDLLTNDYAPHRKAYTGLEYVVPINVNFGAYPFRYEITSQPAGATGTIGETLIESAEGTLVKPSNYGIYKCSDLPAGIQTIEITVYDQDFGRGSTALVITWTVDVSTTGHIFVDASVATSGDGSISSPFKGIGDWYGTLQSDNTYQGFHVHYLTGTYIVEPFDIANSAFKLDATKPLVHKAFPGHSVNFDVKLAKMFTQDSLNACDDLYFSGITVINQGAQRKQNAHGLWVTGKHNRVGLYDSVFDNLNRGGNLGFGGWQPATAYLAGEWLSNNGISYLAIIDHTSSALFETDRVAEPTTIWHVGNEVTGDAWVTSTVYTAGDVVRDLAVNTVDYQCVVSHTSGTFATDLAAGNWITALPGEIGNDNPAGIFFTNIDRDDFTLNHVSTTGTNNCPLFDGYGNTNASINHVTLSNMTWAQGFYFKVGNAKCCITGLYSVANDGGETGIIELGSSISAQGTQQEQIEIRYCTTESLAALNQRGINVWAGATDNGDPTIPFWVHHNTSVGQIGGLDKSYTANVNNNIAATDMSPEIQVTRTLTIWNNTNNLVTTLAGTPLDANYFLTGQPRIDWLGLRGAEIKAEYQV